MKNDDMIQAPKLIAIVGGSGAGKTWLAERLIRIFGSHGSRLSMDDFYRDRSHLSPARRVRINFDHPRALDWTRFRTVLGACRTGQYTSVPRYCFTNHRRLPDEEWRPESVVIVEGLWLLLRREVREQFALRIYLDCPASVRLHRRLQRDLAGRGRTAESIRSQLRSTVMPMHELHVTPQARWADVILSHPFRRDALHLLADRVWNLFSADHWAGRPLGDREAFRAEVCRLCQSED